MIFTAENILLIGSVLIFTSILISKTGYRFGIPTLLLFLLVGMLFGSDGLGLQFNSAEDAQFIGMMALSIILFTGGMETKFTDIKPVLKEGIVLSTVGVLLTTLLTGLFIFYISGWNSTNIELTFMVSLLLAATMSSTDSASVFSLLRSQKMNLKENLRPMLELESGSNDPMAYMLTIVLIQVISSGSSLSIGLLIKDLFVQFLIGGALGYSMGRRTVKFISLFHTSSQYGFHHFYGYRYAERKWLSGCIYSRCGGRKHETVISKGDKYIYEWSHMAVSDHNVYYPRIACKSS